MRICTNCGAQLGDQERFCVNCGQPVQDAQQGGFRQAGQAPNGQAFGGPNYQGQPGYGTPNGMGGAWQNPQPNYQVLERPVLNNGHAAIIGYLGWIGFLIAMIGGDRKDTYARHHLNQALLMNIVMTAAVILYTAGGALAGVGSVVYGFFGRSPAFVIGVILLVLGLAALVFTIVCWFMALISACRGQAKPVLLFGQFRIMK